MIVIISFLTVLSAIAAGVVAVQKISAGQAAKAERVAEQANEID